MALVADFKHTLEAVNTLLEAQRACMAPTQFATTLHGVAESMVNKVAAMPFISVQECQDITNIVQTCIFSAEQKKRVLHNIDSEVYDRPACSGSWIKGADPAHADAKCILHGERLAHLVRQIQKCKPKSECHG